MSKMVDYCINSSGADTACLSGALEFTADCSMFSLLCSMYSIFVSILLFSFAHYIDLIRFWYRQTIPDEAVQMV